MTLVTRCQPQTRGVCCPTHSVRQRAPSRGLSEPQRGSGPRRSAARVGGDPAGGTHLPAGPRTEGIPSARHLPTGCRDGRLPADRIHLSAGRRTEGFPPAGHLPPAPGDRGSTASRQLAAAGIFSSRDPPVRSRWRRNAGLRRRPGDTAESPPGTQARLTARSPRCAPAPRRAGRPRDASTGSGAARRRCQATRPPLSPWSRPLPPSLPPSRRRRRAAAPEHRPPPPPPPPPEPGQ